MERVTGIGGVFFKASDPKQLQRWYEESLGVPRAAGDAVVFESRDVENPDQKTQTVWAPFARDTRYFEPSAAPFMINYRVRDLDAMLAQLRRAGVQVDERVEDSEYGRFGWAMDPEGNRFELWQPPDAK